MALEIETFSNQSGGNVFYKAISHPLAAPLATEFLAKLQAMGDIALFDPASRALEFSQFHALTALPLVGYFVQDVMHMTKRFAGMKASPLHDLAHCKAKAVLVLDFECERALSALSGLLPAGAQFYTLDALKLPSHMWGGRYLSPLNFATNFAFFRDAGGLHTRLQTANYWAGYGANSAKLYARLYNEAGALMAEWLDDLPAHNASLVIDSAKIRARFNLPEFTGQLFIHILHASGHDIVKYALDTYGDDPSILSCTHDANSWPSSWFAGLPAPAEQEEVLLWVQNCHAITIPAGAIALNLMGDAGSRSVMPEALPPYATRPLSVGALLPQARWPQQVEIEAGKYLVRPRYEVVAKDSGRRRIAHPNVERDDLTPDDRLAAQRPWLGKLHILPAPILPPREYESLMQPTPMSRGLVAQPLRVLLFNAAGQKLADHSFGTVLRQNSFAFDLSAFAQSCGLDAEYGHAELIYDFDAPNAPAPDGWLHSLFRYRHRASQHVAETSFGSHIFNTPMVYKNEPQSYAGKPPGLSTRLFLRLGGPNTEAFCHLIYPVSRCWHEFSSTQLILMRGDGEALAEKNVRIAASGSLLFTASDIFAAADLLQAGDSGYILIRDASCRLFGYHGLLNRQSSASFAFSLDHMFGF